MTLRFRQPLAAILCAGLFVLGGQGMAQNAPVERDGVWAQEYSDLKPDAAVRFGTLPNRMRYALLRNATPARQVSVRFGIAAGSIEENDRQLGLAHFLEHMAFKGSTNIPEGDLVRMLQRLGLAFGADTNASTSWDQTIYQFDLANGDAASLDAGLLIARETASELSLRQSAMDPERGVILSEERLRDTPSYRANKAEIQFLLKGQRAAERFPIGDTGIIRNAPVSEMADFYRTYYRPENAVLVVVGDIALDATETKIKTRFSSWANPAPARPKPDLGTVAARPAQQLAITVPGAPLDIEASWLAPYDNAADTVSDRRRKLLRQVGLSILNDRLDEAAQSADPPFLRASVSRDGFFRSADIASLSVDAAPEKWRRALVEAEVLRRQAVQFGVRSDEVTRKILEFRTNLQAQAQAAATRRTPQLAGGLIDAAMDNHVFTSPAEDLAMFEAYAPSITPDAVSAALRSVFTGAAQVFVASPNTIEGGNAGVAAAWNEAEARPMAASVAQADKVWPYANSFGTPGRVTAQRLVNDLGVTYLTFANGVRLIVKPTKFADNQILVSVNLGKGLLQLPADRAAPQWSTGAFIGGGLKTLNERDLERLFTSNIVSANLRTGEDAFTLQGGTRPADLKLQLELLAAYATDAGYRQESFVRTATSLENRLERLDATPSGALSRTLDQRLHDGDARWSQPTEQQVAATQLSDYVDFVRGALASGPVEIVVTGDTTVEAATEAVAATFGALPPRATPTASLSRTVRFPAPQAEPAIVRHKGRPDQSIGFIAWRGDDFLADAQRMRALRIAEQVLQMRLIDRLRTAEGNTYSPSTDFDASQVFDHYGYVSASAETPPDKLPEFFGAAQSIAADIARDGITEDEMQRARAPRIEALERAQQTNAYWLAALAGSDEDARRLAVIRDTMSGLRKVTLPDVKSAAAEYLTPARAWKIEVLPAPPQ